jgi:hypothetical protein
MFLKEIKTMSKTKLTAEGQRIANSNFIKMRRNRIKSQRKTAYPVYFNDHQVGAILFQPHIGDTILHYEVIDINKNHQIIVE